METNELTINGQPGVSRDRPSGIDVIGEVPWGTHFCQFYRTKQDLLDILVPYFKAGLENNEFCMWVTAEPLEAAEAREAMSRAIPRFEEYLSSGQIEIIPYTEWYLLGGAFSEERVLQGWVDKLNGALDRGYVGLRLTGNTFFLERDQWQAFTDYEATVNDVIGKYRMLAICTYCLDKCDGAAVVDVVKNHQFALIKEEGVWDIIESTVYRQAKEALRESEQKFHAILEGISDGFVAFDREWRYTYVNDAAARFLHKKREELLGRVVWDVFPAALMARFYAEFNRAVAENVPVQFEEYYPEPLNAWYECRCYPGPDGLSVFFQDVTGRKSDESSIKEARDKAEASGKRLEVILKIVPSGVIIIEGPERRISYVNERAIELYGIDPTGMTTETRASVVKLLKPDGSPYPADELPSSRALSHGEVVRNAEILIGRPDGRRLTVLSGAAPLADMDGNIVAAVGAFEDITEHKLLEQRLEIAAREWQTTFDAMTEMISIHDRDFRLLRVNRAYADIFNTAPASLTGKHCYQVVHGRESPVLGCPHQELLDTGEASRREIFEPLLDAHIEVSVAPIRGDGDAITGSVHVIRDITERKKAEEALFREKLVREAVMENSAVHLAYLDPQFNFVLVNSTYARGCGHSMEELVGRNHFDLFPDAENRDIFEQVRDTGQAAAFLDRPFTFADQPERGVTYWDWTLTPVKDNAGAVQGLVLSLAETTERKRAENEIRQLNEMLVRRAAELSAANRELEAFSYSVSHDLRSPLRSMEGFSDALLEDYGDRLDDKGRQYLAWIKESSDLMSRLIDDLLKLSRVTRGEMRLERMDLTSMAEAVIAGMQQREPGRAMECAVAPGLVCRGDAQLLQVLLENLLGNAWKFTARAGSPRIEMGAAEYNGRPVFFVRDNGAGFDMTYADKLFQPFHRLHRSADFAGTGIGLATVQRIVRRHGGEIWAEGKVGEGATFYFTLLGEGIIE